MELIDTHCHLDAAEFDGQVVDLIARARQLGITSFVVPGVREMYWPGLLSLCRDQKNVYAAPGLHPLYLECHRPEHLDHLSDLCDNSPVIAIGEIGLDYFDASLDRNRQQILFEAQLKIAGATQLPVILHVRKAHDQVLATLRRKKFPHGGIVHAFSGSLQQADQYISLGFAIGIGGTVTYTRANRIRKLAATLPETNLVLETDAPDMPGSSHRGEVNLPEYLPENLIVISELRGEDLEYTASYTTANARRFLRLPPVWNTPATQSS